MTKADQRKMVQIITVAATMLLVIMVVSLIINLVTLVKLKSRAQELQRVLEQLQTQNTQLDEEIEYRGTDAYQERYAREQLGLTNPNEKSFEAR